MTTRLTAIAWLWLLAGCVSSRPTPTRYSLDALHEPSEPGVKLHATIAIPEVVAPSWLRTEAMIYRLDYQAGPQPIPYARAEWQAPPGEMITMRLRQLITEANSGFTLSRLDKEADGYKLSVSLESFVQVFSQPHESRCIVRMIATLTGPGGRLLGQRTFHAERPAPSGNAVGGCPGAETSQRCRARADRHVGRRDVAAINCLRSACGLRGRAQSRLEIMILDRTLNAAPMMGRTDRHCRYFFRGFSARMLLYTEMIRAADLLRGDCAPLLEFDPEEHPVALQLGGSDPQELAAAACRGEQAGYDEINLNCGCPSDRATDGVFGAYLMQRPETVANCVAAMRAVVRVPVKVKMRIGVIEGRGTTAIEASRRFDDAEHAALYRFVGTVRDAGCDAVIVHARKAVLGGLSAQDNRKIPPLQYDVVSQVKKDFPELQVVINGGLREPDAMIRVLESLDGIMLGREAYHRPLILARLDALVFGAGPNSGDPRSAQDALGAVARARAIERMQRYTEHQLARGEPLSAIVRHIQGLYAGEPGAHEFRRTLSEGARRAGAGAEVLAQAVASTEGR